MEKNGIFNANSSFIKFWNTKVLSKWFYDHVSPLWLEKEWQYNSELFQRWMKLTK